MTLDQQIEIAQQQVKYNEIELNKEYHSKYGKFFINDLSQELIDKSIKDYQNLIDLQWKKIQEFIKI